MSDEFLDGFNGGLLTGNTLDTFMAKLDLEGQFCCLKHSPEAIELPAVPAIDYLCQNLGNNNNGEVTEQLRVPICEECLKGLYDTNWALLYCVSCHNSQWVYKPRSKHNFNTDVVWLNECPHCIKKEEEYGKN